MKYIFTKEIRSARTWKTLAWLCLVTLAVVSFISARKILEKDKQIERLKQEVSAYQITHVHQWFMTESCSDQLLNSGILQIKLK